RVLVQPSSLGTSFLCPNRNALKGEARTAIRASPGVFPLARGASGPPAALMSPTDTRVVLFRPSQRAFFIGEAMNDLETGYNSTTCRDTQPLQEEDTPCDTSLGTHTP